MDYVNVRGSDLVDELGWQTFDNRRDYFTAMLVYKIVHETAPRRLHDSFTLCRYTHDLPTRASVHGNLQIPQPNCEIFKSALKYQGVALWNGLPSYLKDAPDIHSFE